MSAANDFSRKLYSQVYYENKTKPTRQENLIKRRLANLERESGIVLTVEEYRALETKQNGCCAICGIGGHRLARGLHIDHSAGKVRGLLCHRCADFIGFGGPLLAAAIRYLS